MKSKIVIILSFALAACSNEQKTKKDSIQGLYVTNYESEYSKAMDTIEITPVNKNAGTFNYIRRIGYRRVSNGNIGSVEYKTETSTCVFDENTSQLNEQKYGRVYSLSTDGNQVVCGSSVYKRIR